jgi:hypothetical protein
LGTFGNKKLGALTYLIFLKIISFSISVKSSPTLYPSESDPPVGTFLFLVSLSASLSISFLKVEKSMQDKYRLSFLIKL